VQVGDLTMQNKMWRLDIGKGHTSRGLLAAKSSRALTQRKLRCEMTDRIGEEVGGSITQKMSGNGKSGTLGRLG